MSFRRPNPTKPRKPLLRKSTLLGSGVAVIAETFVKTRREQVLTSEGCIIET
jgi:hypothetical protein